MFSQFDTAALSHDLRATRVALEAAEPNTCRSELRTEIRYSTLLGAALQVALVLQIGFFAWSVCNLKRQTPALSPALAETESDSSSDSPQFTPLKALGVERLGPTRPSDLKK